MISKISELMYHEHEVILEGIQLAKALDKSWEKSTEDYESNLKWLIAFFKEYADRFHHYKEEEVLFPVLMKSGEPSIISVINELLEHHEDFRDLVKEIYADVEAKNYEEAQRKLNNYCHDLIDHIAAENEELFPMMDTLLNDDDLEKLYYQCLDKDNELGMARKEELENFIKNFNYKQDEIIR
jgi:hemerythrin-like domain-containing protein